MPRRIIKTLFFFCMFSCALASGCRRKEQLAVVPVPTPSKASEINPQVVELRPLTQLSPNRLTHLAVDSLGNIYWVQETSSGQDILFVSGTNDIPQPTELTSSAIIAAFGPASSKDAASHAMGNIQSIAIDSDDNVLFFFTGGIGKTTRLCLGEFTPHDGSIRILADAHTLAESSQMGASIELARGQIIKPTTPRADQRTRFWLWLHHSDAAAFLRFDPHSNETGKQLELAPAFAHLSGDGAPANLSSDLLEFSAGVDESLLMVDWGSATLWRVNENGLATQWMTLQGLPRNLSEPAIQPNGNAFAFAPVGDPAVRTEGDRQIMNDGHFLRIPYPALLAITADDVIPLGTADDIHSPPTVDIPHLKLRTLVPTSASHAWVAYDEVSGLLLRMRINAKN